jgi:HK97 gp10 family phage protein
MSATITGVDKAIAALKRAPDVFRDRLNYATAATGKEIARGAQARLASSPSIQTRNLYNAVASTMSRKTGRGKVGISAGSTRIGKLRVKGFVKAGRGGSARHSEGASVDYPSKRAHFVEFGTRHMPAEPFMLPAADAQKQPYVDRCTAAAKQAEQDLAEK